MLKRLVLVLIAVLSVATARAADTAYVGDTLNLQYRSTGYLEIEITGPRALVDAAKGSAKTGTDCGYTLSWGDGPATPDATCAVTLKHKYAKPGRYELEAHVTDPKDPNAVNGQLHGRLAVILN